MRALLFIVSLSSLQAMAAPPPPPPSNTAVFEGVSRIVAVGDIHGDYDKFLAVLKLCQISDEKQHWIAGTTHLVQTGDVLDRGPDSKKVMDLLMQLEAQAEKAGGHVHALIGNHEYMTMSGDLRYVSDGELAAFGDGPRGSSVGTMPLAPLTRYRAAFAATAPYGRYIAAHNAIVKINGTLFMHGGISPRYMNRDIGQLNDFIRAELRGERPKENGVGSDDEGPLWFRGLSQAMAPPGLETYLQTMLAAQKARRIVLGHTIQERGITLRAGDRLALIDVGMSRMTLNGQPSCLVIEPTPSGDRVTILRP